MGYRHPNPRLVKGHRNYSVEEIARLFALHKNTVRTRPSAENETGLRARTDFLHRLPRAQDAGREHGGVHPDRGKGGKPMRYLSGL